VTQHDNK